MTQPSNTSIEERLRDYGQLLDHHIESPPAVHVEPTRDRPLRTWLAVAAALVIVALGGVAVAVAVDRTEITTTGPTDSVASEEAVTTTSVPSEESTSSNPDPAPDVEPEAPVGIEPAPDPDGFAGVEGCVSGIEETQDEIGPAFPAHFEPRTETEHVVVLPLPASPAAVQVLLIGPGGFYDCRTARNGETIYDQGIGLVDPFQAVDASEILLVDKHWSSSTEDGMTGPGTVQTIGRVGADVEAVWVALGDGTTLPAIVTEDGWFAVDGRIPADVLLFEETYYWRLVDATVRSAPLDAFDEETAEDQCAASPGCVEQRLIEMQAAAQSAGLDEQAIALADGSISDVELQEATRNVVDCLNQAGIQATLRGDGTGYSTESRPGDDPDQALAAQQTCNQEHRNLISELRLLREAEADLADGD